MSEYPLAKERLFCAALEATNRGWPVFMLGRNKRPVANCAVCAEASAVHDPQACGCLTCHSFYAAVTESARIAAMVAAVPRGQLALRTGSASGVLVVDVDPRNGGMASLRMLIAGGLTPPTLRVHTGSGGLHLYYRHPGRYVHSRGLPGHPGIDIKADGGYVVLPPSIHPDTGRPYQWAPPRPIAEMPPPLILACAALPATLAPAIPVTGPIATFEGRGISHPDRLLAANLDAVRHAPQGRRRTTLYGAARGVARMVAAEAIERDAALAALFEVGRKAGQTERDIRKAIAGAFRSEGVPL